MTKYFYITAGIWTLNAIFNLITGDIYMGIQLGLASMIFWMWAYLLEEEAQKRRNVK